MIVLFPILLALAGLPDRPTQTRTPTSAVDLNRAPAWVLTRLPGIGPKRAAEIVQARKQRPFVRVRDLLRIKGIGAKTLAKLIPLVRVERVRLTPAPRPPQSPARAKARRPQSPPE